MQKGELYLWVTIKPCTDSQSLWEQVKMYGVNVTDLGEKTYVHGETNLMDAVKIISKCELYGTIEVSLSQVGK